MSTSTTVTAAVLVIGDEILSGRTKDRNLGYIAEYLGRIGIDLREARVVPDIEDEIVAAVNALRARYDYLITTGGIGPTHDDITADSIGRAFGVAVGEDPRAIAIMLERYAPADLTPARRRMARIPEGADLIENPDLPGAWLPNRQCLRARRRAGGHAGDARLRRQVDEDRGRDAGRDHRRGKPSRGPVRRAPGRDRRRPSGRRRSAPTHPSGTGASTTRSSCAARTQRPWPRRGAPSRRWSPSCREPPWPAEARTRLRRKRC